MKSLLSFLLLTGFAASISAQVLPPQMQLSADGHQLFTGKSAPDGLYDSSIVRSVYLEFPQTNYWSLLTSNYSSKTDLLANMTVDGVAYDSIGVRFKGQTSYQMAGNSQKKSFNLTMDHVRPDQDLMGYQTLNLNNSFQDASFLREVFYLHQIRRHIPVAKANYVNLYLNGQNWGLYPNVQQLNKTFLKEWFFSNDGINWRADAPSGSGGGTGGGPGGGPGWGDGTAGFNYLGTDTSLYKQYYTLKSSDLENPWDYLVEATYALNNTPAAQLPEVLPAFLDIDRTLWHLASEIAFTDDDSYVYKGKMDYYLYYEPETGRITPIEFDGNSAMETNLVTSWSPFYNANKVNYPLLNKILAVPQWRQRYLAHLRTIIAEELDVNTCNAMLDNYKAQISALVQADPKKAYTFAQFTSEVTVLKNFVSNRRNYLLSNAEVAQVAPTIQNVTLINSAGYEWAKPVGNETPTVKATVVSTNGVSAVNAYYSTELTGNFTKITMSDDGQHNDGNSGDGVYGATLPAQAPGTWVRFYVEAVAANTALSTSYLPTGAEHDVYVYQVQAELAAGPVAINEVMATNTVTATDEEDKYEDWIELYNNTNQAVDLSGYYLSDNPDNLTKYQIPAGVSIPANGYFIFWADEDSADGANHCNFKLSAAGEILFLINPSVQIVDSVSFGAQVSDMGLARVPNGTGNFVIQAPTFNANNAPTGTADIEGYDAAFRLMPNPTSDVTYFRLDSELNGLPITVRDAQGRTLREITPSGNVTPISTANWPSGMYFVQYGGAVQKLIVK
jgi:hypothetical protein